MSSSGKNKMVTSGYETKFRGETAYVCYLDIYSIFLIIEPYQHSWCFTKPNKTLLTSSSRLFTHPIIPRLLQDQKIICHWDPMYLVSFHHASTILEKLGWKSFITLLTHNSGGIFIHPLAFLYWYRLAY